MTELLHDLGLVLGHCPKRVVAVVSAISLLAGVAIASQIRHNNAVLGSRRRSDLVPSHMCFRMPMQRQQRRAIALVNTRMAAPEVLMY